MIARLLISPNIEQRKEEILKQLRSHLPARQAGMSGGDTNHPDLLYIPSDLKLGIVEARKIKNHFSLKPYSAKGRVVVLEDAEELTVDAQNALLKTLEELPEQALFILGASSGSMFLPTVLSRCEITQIPPGRWDNLAPSTQDIEKLLQSTIEQRFEYIEKLKNREQFLKDLISYFYHNMASHLEGGSVNFLKELLEAEKWQKHNVNIRAILEYLMLKMPKSESSN